MDVYQWQREHGAPQSPHLPAPRAATTVGVAWRGAQTPVIIEPITALGAACYAFRPAGAPLSSAFVVAQDASRGDDFGNDNPDADAFGFRDKGALRPLSPFSLQYHGVDGLVANIERGWYGRLDLQVGEEAGSCRSTFYAATGRLTRAYDDGGMIIGMMISPGPHLLREPDYDPPLQTPPWCEPSEAPTLLAQLSNEQLAAYLAQQQGDATTAAGFARAWLGWSSAERRVWLPPLEREIEGELYQLMKWVYWSAPQFKQPKDFPDTPRRPQQWFRPRFVVQSEGIGELIIDARWFGPGTGDKMQWLEHRLKRIWPHIERAFAAQCTQLQMQRDALPPSVAHWCFRRGCYQVTFAPPSAHEQIESRVALSEWLRERAGVELNDIERELTP